MLKDEVTILVNSCDSYSDCWYPFFKLWYDFFPDHEVRIILNTESKTFSFPGLEIECLQLYQPGECPKFGAQLNAHLEHIQTPFVLTMLEDFFLNTPVEIDRIAKCLEYLKNDENAAVFYFTNVVDDMNSKSEKYPGFTQKDKISPYKINTMAALWKKEKLLFHSIPEATPWEWEYFGTIRSYDTTDTFYAVCRDIPPIMCFKNVPDYAKELGFPQLWGIVRGKWVVDSVDALFRAHGIEVDYSQRGEFSPEELKRQMSSFSRSAPLEVLVGTKAAKDLIQFERRNRIRKMLHMPPYKDYIEFRRFKENR